MNECTDGRTDGRALRVRGRGELRASRLRADESVRRSVVDSACVRVWVGGGGVELGWVGVGCGEDGMRWMHERLFLSSLVALSSAGYSFLDSFFFSFFLCFVRYYTVTSFRFVVVHTPTPTPHLLFSRAHARGSAGGGCLDCDCDCATSESKLFALSQQPRRTRKHFNTLPHDRQSRLHSLEQNRTEPN